MTNKGDLISRETLLNEFNTKCRRKCPTCEYLKWNSKLNRYECELINTAPTVSFMISPDYVTELQNRNKELIKQLEEAERPQGEWIPVSERLPEEFQRILVTIVNYKGDKVVRVAEYYHRGKGVFQIKENREQWEVGEKGLLAWQPLPEPYKEEG